MNVRMTDGSTLTWKHVRSLQERGRDEHRYFWCDSCGAGAELCEAMKLTLNGRRCVVCMRCWEGWSA